MFHACVGGMTVRVVRTAREDLGASSHDGSRTGSALTRSEAQVTTRCRAAPRRRGARGPGRCRPGRIRGLAPLPSLPTRLSTRAEIDWLNGSADTLDRGRSGGPQPWPAHTSFARWLTELGYQLSTSRSGGDDHRVSEDSGPTAPRGCSELTVASIVRRVVGPVL